MMTRAEHLAWCKKRALEYVDAGMLPQAVASMGSDLNKHPETQALIVKPPNALVVYGSTEEIVREWIEGFQ